MSERDAAIAAFLRQHNWGDAQRQNFAADFSPRRYARLTSAQGASVILMDADADQKTAAFVSLAAQLRQLDITAPDIYAADIEQGLVLMQDFGHRNCGGLIDTGDDPRLYSRKAAQLLAHLHSHFVLPVTPHDLPHFNTALFAQQVGLFIDVYVPFVLHRPVTAAEREDFTQAWQTVLADVESQPQSLMLRDFMFDNLMHLPQVEGWRGIGVLDFQDAGIGPMAYDLASLGGDQVRRDLDETLLREIVACYVAYAPLKRAVEDWLHDCHVLAAQRHMRIMGIIARLATEAQRIDKLVFLPRIKRHMRQLLKDERLINIRHWLDKMKLDHE